MTRRGGDAASRALTGVPELRALVRSLGYAVFLVSAYACAPRSGAAAATGGALDVGERLAVAGTDEPSPYFVREGEPFCFVGTNNYYLGYMPKKATLDVLESAAQARFQVVRTWAFLDRGSLDGVVTNVHEHGHKEGVYFQYWDPEKGAPAYNDGESGLERLDFVLHEARKRGLLLTLVLTNNWRDFGGMDQYLRWYGLERHHEFYTDERVRNAYKAWVEHLLTRVNSIDGVPYREDPAIFAWELANEPRAMNLESYDSPTGWDTRTLVDWAREMSAFVESLDPNHMISVGDEGFLNEGRDDERYHALMGVDNEALTALPHVDFGTYHLYPDHWRKDDRWGNDWIEAHIELGRRLNKPMVLAEYGTRAQRRDGTTGPVTSGGARRDVAYRNWNDLVLQRGGQAAMFWMLAGNLPGGRYPDYDGFAVYEGDESHALLTHYANRFPAEARACRLAKGASHGEPSRFVEARPAPRRRAAK